VFRFFINVIVVVVEYLVGCVQMHNLLIEYFIKFRIKYLNFISHIFYVYYGLRVVNDFCCVFVHNYKIIDGFFVEMNKHIIKIVIVMIVCFVFFIYMYAKFFVR
tara:strand:+ start:30457 stop:30768 length:312 start_codon:yes stop_codon:yes gene_type:complete